MLSPTDLLRFMKALDTALPTEATLVIIGGCAAALGYGYQRATTDIDTFEKISRTLAAATDEARTRTGLQVHMDYAAVACPPWNWEDRLVPVDNDYQRLHLLIPEIHDLVLMKLERAAMHDIEAAIAMRDTGLLDAEVLITRYRDEMTHCIGDVRRRRSVFVWALQQLFGDVVQRRAAKFLR